MMRSCTRYLSSPLGFHDSRRHATTSCIQLLHSPRSCLKVSILGAAGDAVQAPSLMQSRHTFCWQSQWQLNWFVGRLRGTKTVVQQEVADATCLISPCLTRVFERVWSDMDIPLCHVRLLAKKCLLPPPLPGMSLVKSLLTMAPADSQWFSHWKPSSPRSALQ